MSCLFVFREFEGSYELVGRLEQDGGTVCFRYCDSYLAREDPVPISVILPLDDSPASPRATRAFFEAVIPEGPLRRDVQIVARARRDDYFTILDVLRNEPIGALVLSDDEQGPGLGRAYEPFSFDALRRFAASPAEETLSLTLQSRISLAGAQLKVGLYHAGDDPVSGWYLPKGSAPSTHILKVCSDAFPEETTCEALCLRAAKRIDLQPANCFLIDAGVQEPVLAVERFDRCFLEDDARRIDGLPVPRRLHQEDMCQAIGISSGLKYEPTDANYLGLMVGVLRRESTDFNGDRFMLAYYELFHYLVGNCDNHLKNWSMVWSPDWKHKALAPLYDVVNTTRYPSLVREMGVALCPSRVIDNVKREDVLARFETIGVSGFLADSLIGDMLNEVPDALADAAQELVGEGFPSAVSALKAMMPGVRERAVRLRR